MTIGNYYLDPVRSLQCVGVPNKIAKMEGHDINDNGSKNDNPSKGSAEAGDQHEKENKYHVCNEKMIVVMYYLHKL